MKVHRSALKHGVSPEDAVQAATSALWIEPIDEDGPPHRELRLGFDTQARMLETVVLILEAGDERDRRALRPLDATRGNDQLPVMPPAVRWDDVASGRAFGRWQLQGGASRPGDEPTSTTLGPRRSPPLRPRAPARGCAR